VPRLTNDNADVGVAAGTCSGEVAGHISLFSVVLVKLAVGIKDRSYVRDIFVLVQNPKRIGHAGCLKVSFQKTHNRLFFVAEFVSDCHGETFGCQRLANRTTVRRKQAVKQ